MPITNMTMPNTAQWNIIERSTNFSVPNATFTAIQWQSWYTDYWKPSPDNTLIYFTETGLYQISLIAAWDEAVNTAGLRDIRIQRDDSKIIAWDRRDTVNITPVTPISLSATLRTVSNRWIKVLAWQNSGAAKNLVASYGNDFRLTVVRLD